MFGLADGWPAESRPELARGETAASTATTVREVGINKTE